jgi:hypothetical protein
VKREHPTIPPHELIRIGAGKRAASALLYMLAAAWRARNRFHARNDKRILVLEPVGLGDMVSFNPLVRELLAREYEVLLCSKPEWRPLYPDRRNQTWIDLRLPWTSHNENIKYRPGLYFQEPTRGDLRHLRAAATGAIGIDTRGDIRSVLLLYWAGCRRVISLSSYLGSNLPMWRVSAEIVPFDNSIRRWELNLRFLRALEPNFEIASVAPPRLDHFIGRQPLRRAALMPVAPWAGKLWPRERWLAVAENLRERGWEVIGLCGPGQTEKAAQQIGRDIPLTECGSLESWVRQFNQCAFVITVDSGPMHLADALDVPVIALFGQGKLPLWAPSGKQSVPISHQDDPDFYVCHPIDENVPLGQKFMNRISVAEVMTAVGKIAR